MPAGKRPTLEDTVTARRTLLDGLARDVDIFELESELVPLHPRDNTFPGEVFLCLAADALDWCGASRADPALLAEVAWGQTDDFWQYALFATVAYIRAAASRVGVPVRQACQDLSGRPGHPAP